MTDTPQSRFDRQAYWRRHLVRTGVLLTVWALVAFGLGIAFVEVLNTIHVAGMPLGFWIAQQGSIYVFVLLILVHALLSGRAERKAGLEETVESVSAPTEAH